jgi:hypothetical protein
MLTNSNKPYTAAIDPTKSRFPMKPVEGETLIGDLRMPATATDVAMLIELGRLAEKSKGYMECQ